MKIKTSEGDVFVEALEDGRIKLTGDPFRVDYAIVTIEHIHNSAELWNWDKNNIPYQIYHPLSQLLNASTGHA